MTCLRRGLKNQSGQFLIESVLIMVMLVGVATITAKYFVSQEVVRKLVRGPWDYLDGMIQNGVWGAAAETASKHPNHPTRRISLKGDSP